MKRLVQNFTLLKNKNIIERFMDEINDRIIAILGSSLPPSIKKDRIKELVIEYEYKFRLEAVDLSIVCHYDNIEDFMFLNNLPKEPVNIFGVEYSNAAQAAWFRDEPIHYVLDKLKNQKDEFYRFIKPDMESVSIDRDKEKDELRERIRKLEKTNEAHKNKISILKYESSFYRKHGRDMTKEEKDKLIKKKENIFKWKNIEICIDAINYIDIYTARKETNIKLYTLKNRILDEDDNDARIVNVDIYRKYLAEYRRIQDK